MSFIILPQYWVSAKCQCRCVTVKDLFESNDRARLFRFPGTPEIIVEDYTVVMFCRQSDIVSPVVVWDTVQDNVRKIRNFRNMWLVHMDAVKNVLTVFTLCGDSFPIELEQTKWSLNGQKLDAKIVQLTTPGRQPLLWADLRGKRKECTILHSRDKVAQFLAKNENYDMLYVTYNRAMDKLSVRWIEYPQDMWEDGNLIGGSALIIPSLVCRFMEPQRLFFYSALKQYFNNHPVPTAHEGSLRPIICLCLW